MNAERIFNIPGTVWVTLTVVITKWLSDSFPDQPWLPAVVVVLGALGKILQVYWPKPAEPAAPAMDSRDGDDYTWQDAKPASKTNKLAAFLLG